MKFIKKHKKVFIILLYLVVIILVNKYINLYSDVYSYYKDRMYQDFKNFGKELEYLNENISEILVLDKYNFDDDREFIREGFVRSFWISNFRASDLGNKETYHFDFIYENVNDVIKDILYDKKITESEENYLRTLYDYNDVMINEYKRILGDVYYKYDFDLQQKLEKNIIEIYNEYSWKLEELQNSDKYYFLKNYRGDFTNRSFKKERQYCEEIFYKLIKDQKLEYDYNIDIDTDILRYETELAEEKKNSISIEKPVYEVIFNKKTKKIDINCTRHRFLKKRYTEEELDAVAENIISKFNFNLVSYNKEIRYDDEEKLARIIYRYVEKNNDIYDETRAVEIMLYYDGVLARFKTVYPYDKEGDNPIISKEEVLRKIGRGAEILDIIIVRNIHGKIEYEVHLKYKGTVYATIFDAQTGEVKYYGRNIRAFKKK